MKKKVFMIGYSPNKGGVENYVMALSQNLSEEKIQIFHSVPIMDINGKIWIRPINRHNYIKYWLFWKNFFKVNRFDAVYYNTCDIVSIDMLKFAKKAGVPVRIIHSHNSDNQRKLNFWHKSEEKKNRKNIEKYATHLFACSRVAGEWMFGKKKRFKLINNAIDVNKFQYKETKRETVRTKMSLSNDLVVGMIGRLDHEKNPEFGLRIFQKLKEKNPQSVLVIVGEGKLQRDIVDLINETGLQNSVKMLGRREDVAEIMSAMDCLLMPSKFEGFPFVMVEAQTAGLPCVVSDRISRETDLTGNVHFVSLDAPLEEWAQKIIEASASGNRSSFAEILKQKGYDISDNIAYIEKVLLNE